MLQINDLVKTFKRRPVLKGINLSLQKGERIALVGQNGSGKTTLIRCVLGLHRYEGSIALSGFDPRAQRLAALSNVSFVPQSAPALRSNVKECLLFAERIGGVSSASVENVCQRLNLRLSECMNTPFYKLSGGMRQKFLIGIALARKTGLLIMDEPTANLDPASRGSFYEMLAEIADETALLISSHRVDELADCVTRLIELDDGKVSIDEYISTASEQAKLRQTFRCQVQFTDKNPSFLDFLVQWGFKPDPSGVVWSGDIAGPDRFRLLASLARWAGLISSLKVIEKGGSGHEPI